eukprot:jgi/Bigna1/147331/aug1.141_g22039
MRGGRLLLAFAIQLSAAFKPKHRTIESTYEEIISRRMRFSGAPQEPVTSAAWTEIDFINQKNKPTDLQGSYIATQNQGVKRIQVDFQKRADFTGRGVVFSTALDESQIHSLAAGDRKLLVDKSDALRAVLVKDTAVVVECAEQGSSSSPTCKVVSKVECDFGEPNSATVSEKGIAIIGGSNGLYRVDISPNAASSGYSCEQIPEVPAHFITAVEAWDDGLAAATTDKLYVRDGKSWRNYWINNADMNGGAIDAPVTEMKIGSNHDVLYIVNSVCLNTLQISTGQTARVGASQGMPLMNLSHIHLTSTGGARSRATSKIWVAAQDALIIIDPRDCQSSITGGSNDRCSGIRYLAGPRWLSVHEKILQIAPLKLSPTERARGRVSEALAVLSDAGVSVLTTELWTLGEKASWMEGQIKRHDRYGMTSDCALTTFGDVETCMKRSSDNDGLWTSLTVAAEAFRYAVTGDESARKAAWHYFSALERLLNVTGRKGLPARSVVKKGEPVPPERIWYNSSTMPSWVWKSDTSSDEITGHIFAYTLMHDLVAEAPEEVSKVRRMTDDVVGEIARNGYNLIDVTGEPTTWGHWGPEFLNHNRTWSDQRGLNSMQIIAYLTSALNMTGNTAYLKNLRTLAAEYGYDQNLVNLKVLCPDDDNFSDDQLTFLPYFTYFWNARKKAPLPQAAARVYDAHFRMSIRRTWNAVGPQKSSLWGTMYMAIMKEYPKGEEEAGDHGKEPGSRLLRDIKWNLETWPLELTNYPVNNSRRLDVVFNPELDRFARSHVAGMRILPANERSQFRWNTNPFELDGGNGHADYDPAAWLLPYWMGRYFSILATNNE